MYIHGSLKGNVMFREDRECGCEIITEIYERRRYCLHIRQMSSRSGLS